MISSSDFVALKTFLMVAEQLNFRAAAEQLGLSASAVSQQIAALEQRLGVRLFNRTTRSVSLTDDGQALYQHAAPLLENLTQALGNAQSRSHSLRGTLRIHAFRSAAQRFLDRKVPGFLATWPDVRIDITTQDAPIELVSGGYDLSLRLGEVLDPGLVAVPVGGRLHQIVVASPAYLASHAPIRHPNDLRQHNCIGWRWPGAVLPATWQFRHNNQTLTLPLSGNLVVDDRERQYQAAIAGVGFAQVTAERVETHLASGALVRILTAWEMEFDGYYLCWTAGKTMSPTMRAFIDWLRAD
ncbi:LysR family transcriptional regulator [Kosakonia oryzae]|uniref:DNA-binding transcriptional regulator, LysR family n=1 Tax=Kosakonia oryzae TaxID=497725 RepID=A0AA94H2G2_9ENTR|nr:LysR family transcriptional regulator [Kosakonia oryzae]ANI82898.1 LysR family transcriptional regulator [Kosakonia oryzae]SFC16725.1 DNA-binding transcriptional regulator, LysR family [Kosakonia oryzae]